MKFFQLWQYPVFDDFLDNQGYGNDQVGTDSRKYFVNDFRGRSFGDKINVCTTGKGIDQFEGQTVHMSHGQYGDQPFARIVAHFVQGILQVRPHTAVRQHHSFRSAGCTGSIIDHGQLVRLIRLVMDIFRTQGGGVFLPE